MIDQQIESLSNKLVQFLQDLTWNIQTISNNENARELFQLRSDYARQLACLFEILINQFLNEYQRNCSICLRLDPVQIWRCIQNLIDQLNAMQWNELHLILPSIRNLNRYFYNLLVQIQNMEFLKVDQTCTINRSLIEELNHLAEYLIQFSNNLCLNKSMDTFLFQQELSVNNNNNPCTSTKPTMPSGINTNCYPCYQPTVDVFPCSKPCGGKVEISTPLCFSTPIVYTPEMETLFSSGGIIYARKSGNTWIAENLGTLIETLKDIGENIDMNEHCEILVRKTGELFVRRKRGRRKRFLQRNLNRTTAHAYQQQSDTRTSDED